MKYHIPLIAPSPLLAQPLAPVLSLLQSRGAKYPPRLAVSGGISGAVDSVCTAQWRRSALLGWTACLPVYERERGKKAEEIED